MNRYLLLALLFIFSCKNNNQSSTKETETKTESKDPSKSPDTAVQGNVNKTDTAKDPVKMDENVYRLVVMFYSAASGPEFPLINEYVDSIGIYSQNLGKKVDYKKISWGREGETDVIFHLAELTPAQQADFISMSKRVLAKGKYVNIYENYPYKQRGR